MADYALTSNEHTILRTADNAWIPDDPANTDYAEYLKWVEDGGVPDPYVEPPPPEPVPPEPELSDVVLLDHENRLRLIEGEPAITIEELRGLHGF